MGFIELRAHTAFSFGDGSVSPEALAARAALLGYNAIGITDTADLGGIVRFGLEARRQSIRPIVGTEINIDGCPAAFLARSKEGFNNLASLVTRSRVGELSSWKKGDGKKTRGRPRVSWQQVAERSEGIQVLTGPARSDQRLYSLRRFQGRRAHALPVARCLRRPARGRSAAAPHRRRRSGARRGADRARRAPQGPVGRRARSALHRQRRPARARRAHRAPLRHHHRQGDWRAGCCIRMASGGCSRPRRWRERWQGREEGLEESERIARECDFELAWMRPPLPKFPVPAGYSDDTFLREQSVRGRARAMGRDARATRRPRRSSTSSRVIGKLGFAGFFLVMWDAVRLRAARRTSSARGAAAPPTPRSRTASASPPSIR